MAQFRYDDIESAFNFVSSAGYGLNSAYLDVKTGEIFYRSELTGTDELACLPVAHPDVRQQSGQHSLMDVIGMSIVGRRPDLQLAGDTPELAEQIHPLPNA